MNKDVFDLKRVKEILEKLPASNVFIISGNLTASKIYEERIKEHTQDDRRFSSISNSRGAMDALGFRDSIVFLCGYWWQNKNAVDFIENNIMLAKHVIPVTYIPSKARLKGGENNE